MDLIKSMKWGHASKAINGIQVPQEKVDRILEAINLAPTSADLQAFKVFVVKNKELKEQIRAVTSDQQTITGCSSNLPHVLILVSSDYDTYFLMIKRIRSPDDELLNGYSISIEEFVNHVVVRQK